jgi:hypothetical protein
MYMFEVREVVEVPNNYNHGSKGHVRTSSGSALPLLEFVHTLAHQITDVRQCLCTAVLVHCRYWNSFIQFTALSETDMWILSSAKGSMTGHEVASG